MMPKIDYFNKEFRDRLALLMSESNLTIEMLAEQLEIDLDEAKGYLVDKLPGYDEFAKLIKFFDVSADYLMCLVDGRYERYGINPRSK